MGRNNLVGAWGEQIAAEYLRKKRYKLLAAGYRCRFGEIDLICEEKGFLCFVEVKLRKSGQFGSAGAFVTASKQQKLRSAAQLSLVSHPTDLQPRFDVVEIYAPAGTDTLHPVIARIENAF